MSVELVHVWNLLFTSSLLLIVSSVCAVEHSVTKCCSPGFFLLPNVTKFTCQPDGVNFVTAESSVEFKCSEEKFATSFLIQSFNFSFDSELIIYYGNETFSFSTNDYCVNYTDGASLSVVLCVENEPDHSSNCVGKLCVCKKIVCFQTEHLIGLTSFSKLTLLYCC